METTESILSTIKGKALLAPMLHTADIPFRMISKEFGVALTHTEMVSVRGILEDAPDTYRYAAFDASELPIAIQIVATNANTVPQALKKLRPFNPTLFNINAGCPNERICDAGGGADLLDDLPRLGAIIQAAVKSTDLPLSVKVRGRGMKHGNTIKEIVRTVQDNGASYIIVHGRTKRISYDKPADWDIIAEARQTATIPVVGNGDVFSSADAKSMMDQTGCDGVMVGRGALGAPWIFRDIAEDRNCGIHDFAPTRQELLELITRHMKMTIKEYGEFRAVPRMRKHILWYLRYFTECESLRHQIFARDDSNHILDVVAGFLTDERETYAPESEEYIRTEKLFQNRVLYWVNVS